MTPRGPGPAAASSAAASVLVAMGSNVDAVRNLRRAAAELARAFAGARFSHAYRNAAQGFSGEDFINAVAAFDTSSPLDDVLAALHRIEQLCGRAREAPKWAPRSMDLDVLLYGDLVGEFPGAVLPRPDLVRRAYMLGPAAEIAPAQRHPTLGLTLAELWEGFDRGAHAMQPLELELGAASEP